jgi:translation initiation factor 2 beta subunit (eIF-2beta)/eIF-5
MKAGTFERKEIARVLGMSQSEIEKKLGISNAPIPEQATSRPGIATEQLPPKGVAPEQYNNIADPLVRQYAENPTMQQVLSQQRMNMQSIDSQQRMTMQSLEANYKAQLQSIENQKVMMQQSRNANAIQRGVGTLLGGGKLNVPQEVNSYAQQQIMTDLQYQQQRTQMQMQFEQQKTQTMMQFENQKRSMSEQFANQARQVAEQLRMQDAQKKR